MVLSPSKGPLAKCGIVFSTSKEPINTVDLSQAK